MQERLLIQIVHNDPYLKSVLNSELAHIHDRMTQIVQSVEDVHDRALHTEQRVDSIETRVEQLERPGARKSGINCKCVLPKQLADEASRFHLGHQRQHSAVICSGALLFSSRVLCPSLVTLCSHKSGRCTVELHHASHLWYPPFYTSPMASSALQH